MIKRITSFAVALAMALALALPSGAWVSPTELPVDGKSQECAELLYGIHLFLGSDEGFMLDKVMTRAEAAVMLVRLLGAESEAISQNYAAPFTDIPDWAKPYVGYLYKNNLTYGIGSGLYGSQNPVTVWQYCAFLSRATGVPAAEDNYGVYNIAPESLIDEKGTDPLYRGGACELSVRALCATMRDTGDTLALSLYQKEVFTGKEFFAAAKDIIPYEYELNGENRIVRSKCGLVDKVSDAQINGVNAGFLTLVTDENYNLRTTPDGKYFFATRLDRVKNILSLYQVSTDTLLAGKELDSVYYGDGDAKAAYTYYGDAQGLMYLGVTDHTDTTYSEVFTLSATGENDTVAKGVKQVFTDEASDSMLFVARYGFNTMLTRVDQKGKNSVRVPDTAQVVYYDGSHSVSCCQGDDKTTIVCTFGRDLKTLAEYTAPAGTQIKTDYIGSTSAKTYFTGDAGVYCLSNGAFNRVTTEDADTVCDTSDGIYMMTYASEGSTGRILFAGSDGVKTLVPDGMLTFTVYDTIYMKDGSVRFTTSSDQGMMHLDMFTYTLDENGRVVVLSYVAGRLEMQEKPDEAIIAAEQARIDAIQGAASAART